MSELFGGEWVVGVDGWTGGYSWEHVGWVRRGGEVHGSDDGGGGVDEDELGGGKGWMEDITRSVSSL
ncbi:hypothetical protein Pmani_016110 [Petrolisthes manimaculis]|uniref:Uncharacterized protein n=1 Tax=Petrolisthes manimaculis TaxID=1843537 RepID=A0AAE1PQV9_9EUCA|nr:hypothetical protein Pmani_016110 [Petrolisthes manimaculis]